MSKSVGNILGAGSVKYDKSGANSYINYLKGYDTSKVDNTIGNMENQALDISNNLNNRPDYVYSVDGSDAARQRSEQATYQSFVDKLNPQFANQTGDLQSRLVNQGLTPGTEAYQRAMTDLQNNQNDAYNQAAYQAVNQGQQSFSQSLSDAINSGNYQNTARNLPLAEIQALLANSVSGYDNQQNIYAAATGKAANEYNAKAQTAANRLALTNALISGGANVAGATKGG